MLGPWYLRREVIEARMLLLRALYHILGCLPLVSLQKKDQPYSKDQESRIRACWVTTGRRRSAVCKLAGPVLSTKHVHFHIRMPGPPNEEISLLLPEVRTKHRTKRVMNCGVPEAPSPSKFRVSRRAQTNTHEPMQSQHSTPPHGKP